MNARLNRRGFTLLELLVTLVLGAVILGATYAVMMSQQRFVARQTQIQDSRESLRAAAAILAAELRQAASGGGDLLAIAPDSFVLRTTIGFGIICNSNRPEKRYAVARMWGEWAQDSVLIFADNNPGAADDEWRVHSITAIQTPTTDVCAYGGAAQARVVVDTVKAGLRIGSQMRPFRWYVYKLYPEGDRYWLGRRRLNEVSYTGVVGPLSPPGANAGLALTYLDANGNETALPADVASVQFTVRSESFGPAPALDGQGNRYVRDTLTTRAYLRNN